MKARLRTMGITGSISALLAAGALLIPAASAQAQPLSPYQCEVLVNIMNIAVERGETKYAEEIFADWFEGDCFMH